MCEIRAVCPPQATSTFFSNVNAITGSNLVPSVPGVIGAHIPALGTCVLALYGFTDNFHCIIAGLEDLL